MNETTPRIDSCEELSSPTELRRVPSSCLILHTHWVMARTLLLMETKAGAFPSLRLSRFQSSSKGALDDSEQQQDNHDEDDQADTATTVIADSRPHTITTKSEQQKQNYENDEQHICLSCGRILLAQRSSSELHRGLTGQKHRVTWAENGCTRSAEIRLSA